MHGPRLYLSMAGMPSRLLISSLHPFKRSENELNPPLLPIFKGPSDFSVGRNEQKIIMCENGPLISKKVGVKEVVFRDLQHSFLIN
jgi:hypothetical protein